MAREPACEFTTGEAINRGVAGGMAPKLHPMPRERQDFLARHHLRRCPFSKSSDKIGNHEDLYGLLSERKPEGPILTASCSTRNPRLGITIDNGSTEISAAPRGR